MAWLSDIVFLRGLVLGFSIAAPVGPIGLLCMRRTLTEGRRFGLASGLGAATADALYGSVAAFGLAAVSSVLVNQQVWLRLLGGLFLLYLGVRTFLAKPGSQEAAARGRGLAGAYFSTFFLTLTNPLTILSFTAMFAGLGFGSAQAGWQQALWLVTGVFCGSALWWLLLSGGVSLLRERFNPAAMVWVNRFSGALIAAFGVVALWRVWF